MKQHNFALIGAAGYIAPRHFQAIKETGQHLVAVLDKSDSVGVLDRFFPQAALFLEPERFDRHIYKLYKKGDTAKVHYFSICSPNYLHDSHIRLALRNHASAICEKPVVLNPWNLDALAEIEKETGQSIFHILQLRLHPAIEALKSKIEKEENNKIYDIDLTYITGRGKLYHFSWKGDEAKSGGLISNIGVHFFDMLTYIFGDVKEYRVHYKTESVVSGFLQLQRARVRWFLSIDENFVPEEVRLQGKRTYRSIEIDNQEFEFSDGFTDLHTLSYEKILQGKGFVLADAYPYVVLCHELRTAHISRQKDMEHPLMKLLS